MAARKKNGAAQVDNARDAARAPAGRRSLKDQVREVVVEVAAEAGAAVMTGPV